MDQDEIDQKRRAFLVKATTAVGAVGLAAAAAPFATSLWPSVAAEVAAAPIKVDVSGLQPGAQLTVMWRGRPIWIIRRTPEALASLAEDASLLRDPNSTVEQQPAYTRNRYRSINPEYLVLVGVCTHLGCIPTYRPEPDSVEAGWPGGFFCSCHGSKFDLAGRVFKGVPAPINLEVPPYTFLNDHEILIGVSPESA